MSDTVNVTMGLTIHELTDVSLEERTLTGVFWLNLGNKVAMWSLEKY